MVKTTPCKLSNEPEVLMLVVVRDAGGSSRSSGSGAVAV